MPLRQRPTGWNRTREGGRREGECRERMNRGRGMKDHVDRWRRRTILIFEVLSEKKINRSLTVIQTGSVKKSELIKLLHCSYSVFFLFPSVFSFSVLHKKKPRGIGPPLILILLSLHRHPYLYIPLTLVLSTIYKVVSCFSKYLSLTQTDSCPQCPI